MMTTYEYELIRMEPITTDEGVIQSMLNEKGSEGFRFVTVQKLWTQDDYGQPIQRNFVVLEKAEEDDL
jgi:hypothetical protein